MLSGAVSSVVDCVSAARPSSRILWISGLSAASLLAAGVATRRFWRSDKKEIQDDHYSEDVLCDKTEVGLVIGRGGTSLRHIEAAFQVVVLVGNDRNRIPNAPDGRVVLRVLGRSRTDVVMATSFISRQLTDHRRRQFRKTVIVPVQALGFIIGRDGANFKRIASDTNTFLQVVSSGAGAAATIEIRGDPMDAELAEQQIIQLVDELHDLRCDRANGRRSKFESRAENEMDKFDCRVFN